MLVSSPETSQSVAGEPDPNIMGLLTLVVLKQQLADFSGLDRRALLDTLVPHRDLPSHDPAGFIIAYHHDTQQQAASLVEDEAAVAPAGLVEVDSSYDLGVVFGSSLLRRALPEGHTIPVISEDFNPDKKYLVVKYLDKSKHQPLKRLTSHDSHDNKNLAKASELFAEKCKLIVPDLMIDGEEELQRGLHDYLSVVTLLEISKEQQANTLRRALGHFSLSSLLPKTRKA